MKIPCVFHEYQREIHVTSPLDSAVFESVIIHRCMKCGKSKIVDNEKQTIIVLPNKYRTEYSSGVYANGKEKTK